MSAAMQSNEMRPTLCPVCGSLLTMEGECRYCCYEAIDKEMRGDTLATVLWVAIFILFALFIYMSWSAKPAHASIARRPLLNPPHAAAAGHPGDSL